MTELDPIEGRKRETKGEKPGNHDGTASRRREIGRPRQTNLEMMLEQSLYPCKNEEPHQLKLFGEKCEHVRRCEKISDVRRFQMRQDVGCDVREDVGRCYQM